MSDDKILEDASLPHEPIHRLTKPLSRFLHIEAASGGMLSLTWLWLKVGATRLPSGVTWRHMIGGGFLAGIGFTMALFITGLAFSDDVLLRNAKVGVLMGSAISATIGMILLSTARIETSEKQAGIHDAG